MSVTAFGVLAAVILLASFVLRGETRIRLVNLVGCIFLVLFAINLHPEGNVTFATTRIILLLLGVATIGVHCVQLWHTWKESRSQKAVAKAEARAIEAEKKVDEQLGLASKPVEKTTESIID